MPNLAAVAAQVGTATGINQSIVAVPGGFLPPEDSSAALYTALQSIVSGQMYPLYAGDAPTYPNIVYDLMLATPGEIDGYRITQTDTYMVKLRTEEDYSGLVTAVGSVVTAIDAATSYNMEVASISYHYEEAKKIFTAEIEVEVVYLAQAAQTMPAALVYLLSMDGSESTYDNLIKQEVVNQYGIVVLTADGNMSTLLDNIRAVLLGWEQSTGYNDMEYSSGTSLEGVSGLEVWREVYEYSNYIQEI